MAQALREPIRHTNRATGAATGAASDTLQSSLQNLFETVSQRAMTSMSDRLTGATERLTDYAQGGGGGLVSAVTGVDKLGAPIKSALSAGLGSVTGKVKDSLRGAVGSRGGKKDKGGEKVKITNIVEQIDVGVPVDLAYKQWTQFAEFPKFMKKVENVEQVSDEKLKWKAQVFLSHRTWESTILEQVPNDRIVWRSQGDKGYVDGAVTFHELAPDLTRVIVVLEYHPQGLFERTGNLWRAQGRRVRLELKNFQRHVMAHAVLHADEIEGWHGEIHDGEVVSAKSDKRTRRSAPKPRKAAARSSSASSTRRPAAKAASSSSSRRRQPTKSTGSARKKATKASGSSSTRRRTPAKKGTRR